MAKVFKAEDRLRFSANQDIKESLYIWITFILISALLIMNGWYWWILLVFVISSYLTKKLGRDYVIKKSGIKGENRGLKMVNRISDDYVVFKNLKVAYEGKESETDLIVIGPKGIFVVEIKNHKGIITGDERYREWIQTKGVYKKKFYSPIKQVNTHIYRLSGRLRELGYQNWIIGIVYFVNPNVIVNVKSYKVKTIHGDMGFVEFLNNYEPKVYLQPNEVNEITDLLKKEINSSRTS